jgi:ABC-2 type transport system permease protein
VNDVVVEARFERADPPVDRERIRRLQRKVDFRYVDVATGQETTGDEMTRFLAPFAFMFLLFMGTMTISHGLLTSVIEEKSSRVIEVLLSAVSPIELMAGKILGMVAVGGVLIVIWGGVGYGSAQTRDLDYLVTPYRLTYMVLYFIPGFLLTSAFLAAVGSACNSIKEAQSMAAPLTLLTIVPMMLWWAITQNPNSMLSIVLSYIPPITPFVMILRICADPEISLLEIVATLVLLWASVVGMIWVAGKIFRVGVLMYGKPPSPKEVFRWLCYE